MPLPLPGWLLRMRLLEPMQCATLGSVEAACMAHIHGWAINLGGGFHHATHSSGGGFCIYPDITFITRYMEEWHGINRFMIVDLDAHQGNGHERDHQDKDKYHILDAYNHRIYPGDELAKEFISTDIDASRFNSDERYLRKVREELENAMETFKPKFLIYNAGTDCMRGDPLGRLDISEQGIVDRDEMVFEIFLRRKVPVVMILSGGY